MSLVDRAVDNLVIFGGEPAFTEPLHVGRPNIGDRERLLERFNDILDRRWFTNHGIYVQEFERHIAERAGVRHCIAMCNATVALEIVIRALGLTGEVIVPSLTFVATAHALQWQQITPVFCDVDPATLNLDPRAVEAAITPRTSGIIGVHLWGHPCDVEGLAAVAERHGLSLVFDAAHAFGCTHDGRPIGGFGHAEVFSFHATKFCNSFEGGAVVTNDDELAAKVRLMQNFGFAGYDNVAYIGTNGKMTEVCAAMGLTSLESIDEFVHINRCHYHHYRQALTDLPGVRLLGYDETERTNYQYIVVEIDEPTADISRDQIVEILWAENVLARRYFYPGCHRMEPYHSLFPHADAVLPVTERALDRVMTLPTGSAMSDDDVETVCDRLRCIVLNGHEVATQLMRVRS